jgi:hypothetical protein
MKRVLFFVFASLLIIKEANSQTLRPGVLVVGNGNAAAAAAIQSAMSGIETTILLQAGGFDISPINDDLSSGIQETFLQKIRNAKNIKDSTQAVNFDKILANEVLKKWTDSTKKLTVISNVMWVKADGGTNISTIKLSDGKTIKPKVLINVADAKLNAALKVTALNSGASQKVDYANTTYRTSIASGMNLNGTTANTFSLYNFLLAEKDNFVWVSDPQSMLIGQAAGATAAYAAFFSQKTSVSNLKRIQGELIAYKLNLMPFTDVKRTDSNWKAIQFVGVTGVLKGEFANENLLFVPEKLVTTEEIKQPIKDSYYKAQIWFDDYKSDIITIGAAMEMISYVGNKAIDAMKKDIPKRWKTSYQFKTDFDPERQINRRELAVLLQDYMPPFNVTIDKTGKIIR